MLFHVYMEVELLFYFLLGGCAHPKNISGLADVRSNEEFSELT